MAENQMTGQLKQLAHSAHFVFVEVPYGFHNAALLYEELYGGHPVVMRLD